MEGRVIDTRIVEMDKFYPATAEAGEDLTIYRRLADTYDPTAVALRNSEGEFIGYLDREVAEAEVLPSIREGRKFHCIVVGPGEEEHTLQVQLREYDPEQEVEETEIDLESLGDEEIALGAASEADDADPDAANQGVSKE